MITKICTKCKLPKEITEFGNRSNTSDGKERECKPCISAYRKGYHLLNRDKQNAKHAKWIDNNKEQQKEYRRLLNIRNKSKNSDRWALYYEDNKEALREKGKEYKKKNPDKNRAWENKRRAAKLQRIPCWSSEKDLQAIKNFYTLAVCCEELFGVKYHVDHVIPLQGDLVSGLHVPENLQVITASENITKSNKWEV